MARKKHRTRSLPLDVFAILLWAFATAWQGWPGFVIFLVALLVGGFGTIYNGLREGRLR